MEWIETIDPNSHETAYYNPSTGEMLTEAPADVSIKPMSNDQWWEILDENSNQYYYHNPHTQETVWDRPDSDDIVTITNNAAGGEAVDSHVDNTVDTHQNNIDENSFENTIIPDPLPSVKTPDEFSTPLDTLSPLDVQFNGHRFSMFEASVDEAERRTTTQTTVTSSDSVTYRNESISNKSFTLPRASTDNYPILEPIDDQPQNNILETDEVSDSFKSVKRPSSYTKAIPEVIEPSRPHLDSYLILSMSDISNPFKSQSARGSPTRKASTPVHLETHHARHSSQDVPIAPRPPPLYKSPSSMKRSVSMQADLGKYQELAQHKKGFFRKKVTIANMLSWTKDPIKQPMILIRDRDLRKEAVDLFKLVLQCMGDKRSKIKNPDDLILMIMSRCWERAGLRDELFIQLCRQTTGNPKSESLRRGWELITIGLHFFPPSVRFRGYLEGYVWKHVDPSSEYKKVPVDVYAQYCHRRIEKMVQWGAKKGLKKPTIEEIQYAKTTPFHPSMFGNTLEEVMDLQKEDHPHLEVPWVIVELTETILRLRGPSTQGIFRIPGDIDEVNALKIHIEKGKSVPPTVTDPHIPASLLKLWFRELENPLIPENYYQHCIDNFNDIGNALSLADSLPPLNRSVFMYIIRFLQQFITPESSDQTKMGIDNIAMVWAPNFLRCPSEDHMLIFENTRKEMSFLRTLLKNISPST